MSQKLEPGKGSDAQPQDPQVVAADQARRRLFLRYVNRSWLALGFITLATLPFFPRERIQFLYLIALVFPTYLLTYFLNSATRTRLAGAVITLSVNFGFYGMFLLMVNRLGAEEAFRSQSTIWLLMGLAVLFAGAFIDKWAALALALFDSVLLIGTRLTLAPNADPRPSAPLFWGMMALTIWLYERTLQQAIGQAWSEVAERKQAEEAVRKSQAKFRAVVDNSYDGILFSDANATITYQSPSHNRMNGFSDEERIGHSGFELVHPDDISAVRTSWLQVVQKPGANAQVEYRIQHKDGTWRWIRTNVQNLLNNPDIQEMVVTSRDITERKTAEQKIERQNRELNALQVTILDISSPRPLPELLQLIVERACTLLDTTSGGLYLCDETKQEVRCVVSYHTASDFTGTSLKYGEGAAGQVALTGMPLMIEDYQAWSGRAATFESTPSFERVMSVPMKWEGRVIGVIHALRVKEIPFDNDDLELLTLFANHAALAIEQARLREALEGQLRELMQAEERIKRQLQRLEALHQLDLVITSGLDMTSSLGLLLDQIRSLLEVDAAVILLLEPQTQILHYMAGRGFHSNAIQHTQLQIGNGQAGRAAFERRIVHIPDLTERSDDLTRALSLAQEKFISYYAIPLIVKGLVRGILEIFHRSRLHPDDEWLNFAKTLANQAAIMIEDAQLFRELQRSNFELLVAYDATIEGWSRAMDLRDKETQGHTKRVTDLTLRLARAMNISDSQMTHIRRGALLHDIGKLGVPDHILLKADNLTDEEWVVMRKHPQFAYEMLSEIHYLRAALDIPYCHHEKWDGTGYPRGLKGEDIPPAARIFAVVDVWDAITTDRPYREAWSKEAALQYIQEQSGKYFDPRVVEAFMRIIDSTIPSLPA